MEGALQPTKEKEKNNLCAVTIDPDTGARLYGVLENRICVLRKHNNK